LVEKQIKWSLPRQLAGNPIRKALSPGIIVTHPIRRRAKNVLLSASLTHPPNEPYGPAPPREGNCAPAGNTPSKEALGACPYRKELNS
jgi:hypothetical protein